MGLGLNGGGVAAARFLAENGALVTVTDLRSQEILKPSLDILSSYPIKYRLGEHNLDDFYQADLVIKNPAVPLDSPYLQACRKYETDVSLFLQMTVCPILAITGSKGKSTTVSILHHILKQQYSETFLGGNITVSPLNFIDKATIETPVILELSSWQLADLPDPGVLKPAVSALTNIMHDHQNKYANIQDYLNDKKIIFRNQTPSQYTVLPLNDIGRECAGETAARVVFFSEHGNVSAPISDLGYLDEQGGWLRLGEKTIHLFTNELKVPGKPFLVNTLIASITACLFGVDEKTINRAVNDFTGVEHRLECFLERNGIRFYNDTAATIPDAAAEAVMSFDSPVHLITGGTDKDLIFDPLINVLERPASIHLLAGSATDRLIPLLMAKGISFHGPFTTLRPAVESANKEAAPGSVIVLSPGAASFGMFLNEFDRGRQFKEICTTFSV
jgi:UDP-N-acetylmuramoylalanine--D-glutamate ligase